jgi:hypothetical protein
MPIVIVGGAAIDERLQRRARYRRTDRIVRTLRLRRTRIRQQHAPREALAGVGHAFAESEQAKVADWLTKVALAKK